MRNGGGIQPAPCISYKGCDEPVIQCEPGGLGHHDWKPGGTNPLGAWFLTF